MSEIKGWRGDDPVVSIYARVFNKDTVIDLPWNEQAQAEYLKEMTWRCQHKIPPGYKDARKEDGGIGDLLIWKCLLSLGEGKKMDLAFVTGEQKADWFVRADGGPVYPRHELVDEYRRASGGKSLRLMSLYELLEEMKVDEEVVSDVKDAEVQANTAALLQKTSNVTLLSEGLRPLTLIFTTNRQQSFWAPGKRGEQEGTQLRGIWSVTNVTDRNYYILDARLPNHDTSFVNIAVEDPSAGLYSAQHPIRPNSITELTANFFFFPSICGGTDPFVTDVIFTDNYGGQHLVSSVRFHRIGMP